MSLDNSNPDLGRRHEALLLAIVEDYVANAEPVGSHRLVTEHSLGVKAATVRSMMGELEEEGYLNQPHTSAGRVPTEKAYRFYVDHLLPRSDPGWQERTRIEFCYSERARDLSNLMRDTSRLLSILTGQAALVMAPRLETIALERVNFVRVRPRQVLALFVAMAGGVHTRLIESEQDNNQTELDRMARYLNEVLHGRTLNEARRWIEQALKEERTRYDTMVRAALILGGALMHQSGEAELYVEGSVRALGQPEFTKPERIRELLRALDDKSALLDLLERSLGASRPTVSIGSENGDARLSDLSVVASAYAAGSKVVGSLAVVGPLRMDYGRVIPLVDYTARTLSKIFDPLSVDE